MTDSMKDQNELNLFFDTETSGFISDKKPFDDPTQNWCCQIGAVLCTKDGVISELDTLIKANGRKIPRFLTLEVHGITAEQCDDEGIEETEALELFAEMKKDIPKQICHNFEFDHKFIDQMFKRNMDLLSDEARSKYFIQFPHFCTMKDFGIKNYVEALDKKGRIKWPKLEELYYKLFNKNFPNAHNALADTKATLKCYYKLQELGVV